MSCARSQRFLFYFLSRDSRPSRSMSLKRNARARKRAKSLRSARQCGGDKESFRRKNSHTRGFARFDWRRTPADSPIYSAPVRCGRHVGDMCVECVDIRLDPIICVREAAAAAAAKCVRAVTLSVPLLTLPVARTNRLASLRALSLLWFGGMREQCYTHARTQGACLHKCVCVCA